MLFCVCVCFLRFFWKRDQDIMLRSTTQKVIMDLLEEDAFISSAQIVVDEVKERVDLEVKVAYVTKQMHAMGLKYMKAKHISMQGNSERSLVLRQQWALRFFELDFKAINIINVDETWLGMTDFRRMHWRRSTSN